MAEKSMTDNWRCAGQLEIFKQRVMAPLEERIKDAKRIMKDPKQKWDSKEQKARAQERHDILESEMNMYRALHGSVTDLIHQHEDLVEHLATLYAAWYNQVSYKGTQLGELMDSQVEQLQYIFTEIYKALEPLKLPIQPPCTNPDTTK